MINLEQLDPETEFPPEDEFGKYHSASRPKCFIVSNPLDNTKVRPKLEELLDYVGGTRLDEEYLIRSVIAIQFPYENRLAKSEEIVDKLHQDDPCLDKEEIRSRIYPLIHLMGDALKINAPGLKCTQVTRLPSRSAYMTIAEMIN